MIPLARAVPWKVGPHLRALSTTSQAWRKYTPSVAQSLGKIAPIRAIDPIRALRAKTRHCFDDVLTLLRNSRAGFNEVELDRKAADFIDQVDEAFNLAEAKSPRPRSNPLYWRLQNAFHTRDAEGLTQELRTSFLTSVFDEYFSYEVRNGMRRLLDFRFPHEWFPATRTMQRTIHLHVGPTNSGKTYHALKALENSGCGVYAGPLRLLAVEVYQRLNASGHPCALITGEEIRIPENTDRYFSSCTVEMVPLNTRYDVAVIDEIQMIGDGERGNGWTTALLGVQAKEVHLCGEPRAVGIVRAICASIGDKCVIHHYNRLSPLHTMTKSLESDYKNLQKGDAVIAFSRLTLHGLKRNIESHTGRRCAIVYGTLPPEVRVQQAALFNDPNDYDFIVASDAIGMGLNLEIRRVILESVAKFDGSQNRALTFAELKQIGGRAGRYRTAQTVLETDPKALQETEADRVGYVTTMDRLDLKTLRKAFTSTVSDIQAASIDIPPGIVERFASYFPLDTPLSYLLVRIKELASVGSKYTLNISREVLEIADIIQDLPLSIYDRLTFCYLPASLRSPGSRQVLHALAKTVAGNSSGDLLSIKEIPLDFLDVKLENYNKGALEYLSMLESLHVAINQYVWLSYRYSGLFRSQALALHVRSLVGERLIETLDRMDYTVMQLKYKRQRKKLQAQQEMDAEDFVKRRPEDSKKLKQRHSPLMDWLKRGSGDGGGRQPREAFP